MQFSFDEQQREFRTQLRALLDKECPPSEVRAAWDRGWSQRRWHALAEMGVVGLTVPAAHGGLGLDLVDLVLLLEEAGWACLPEPLVETTALAVPLLVEATGDRAEELRARWLPVVASGEAVVTAAISAADPVHAADGADLVLLPHDGALHALSVAEASVVPHPTLDGAARAATVTFAPSAATLVMTAEDVETAGVLHALGDRAAMATAAVLVGVADRMLALAAHYAGERTQFGRPIGSYQAVKHHLAGAAVRVEFARPAVYRAAWSMSVGDPAAATHVSVAKALASDSAVTAARAALQVHGAIGYTWEHDLHLWMKRAWSLAAAWGDAAWHRARVLAALDTEG